MFPPPTSKRAVNVRAAAHASTISNVAVPPPSTSCTRREASVSIRTPGGRATGFTHTARAHSVPRFAT